MKAEINPSSELLTACIAGKERAIKELYQLSFAYLMHVSHKFCNDRDQSVEKVNMGFMKILSALPSYDHKRSFRNWIHQIMLNLLIDEKRKELRWSEKTEPLQEETMVACTMHSSNDGLEKLFADDVLKLLSTLPERQRTIFALFAIEGKTHAEISKMLKIKTSLSKWHLFKARQKLQKALRPHLLTQLTIIQ